MNNTNQLFAIGIPTINRADLLQETLEKYCKDFPTTLIYVVDNGQQYFNVTKITTNVRFISNNPNVGVAASWNQLCDAIFNGTPAAEKCQHALILNDDIYLGKKEEEVKKFIIENNVTLATTTGTWCAFLLNNYIYNKVGLFDNNIFPAYFEDNDYAYRLQLSGYPHTSHEFLNPEIYRNSQTIAKDPSLNNNFEKNRNYYIQKWGGEPYKETFLTPFNKL